MCGCYIVCRFIQKQLSAGQKLSFFSKIGFQKRYIRVNERACCE